MLITKTIEIDMGHRIPNHNSKCKNIHGHRFKIEVGVDDKIITTEGASNEGMVIDFSDVKQILIDNIDSVFDHGFVMYDKDDFYEMFISLQEGYKQKIIFVPFIPTAENLAKYWYELIEIPLFYKGVNLSYVKVFETPTSSALYTKDICRCNK